MHLVKRKGIVLIMTMMTICLIFMMLHSVVQSTGMGLGMSTSFYDREAALQAAQSGFDYANTRLQTNYGWRGDSNCEYWTGKTSTAKVNYSYPQQGLWIAESNGNVVGLLTNRAGYKSAFRIKFSYETNEDKPGNETFTKAVRNRFGAKNTSDLLPSNDLKIRSPYVSVNNLMYTMPVRMYRANENGVGVADQMPNLELWSQSTDNDLLRSYACSLPEQRACLIVEGVAGKGLRDCNTPEQANKAINDGAIMSHRYIEAYVTANAPVLNGDAAFAETGIDFDVAYKLFVSSKAVASNSDMSSAIDENTVPAQGSLRVGNGAKININGVLNTYNGTLFCGEHDGSFKKDTQKYRYKDGEGEWHEYTFEETRIDNSITNIDPIGWEDVARAENTAGNIIKPGFYQWHTTADSTKDRVRYELRYYENCVIDNDGKPVPKTGSKYKIAVSGNLADGSKTAEGIEKISMGPAHKVLFDIDQEDGSIKSPTINFQGNLYCNGKFILGSDLDSVTATTPCFNITPYTPSDEDMVNVYEDGVLTATEDIYVASSLYGNGAIVSKGDVSFIGTSVLESGNSGVAIYGNNVTLKSLEMAMAAAPSGKSWNNDYTKPTQVEEEEDLKGSLNWTIDAKFYDALMCGETSMHSWAMNQADNYLELICSYLSGRGVRGMVEVRDIDSREINGVRMPIFRFATYFTNEESNKVSSTYIVTVTQEGCTYRLEGDCMDKPYMEVPASARVKKTRPELIENSSSTKVEIPEGLEEHVTQFGSLCPGDQTFGGVVYARNNFIADLKGKYNLSVTGAIRAEKGKIEVNCHGATLTYDESCLKKLMPSYHKLTCKLWNCW